MSRVVRTFDIDPSKISLVAGREIVGDKEFTIVQNGRYFSLVVSDKDTGEVEFTSKYCYTHHNVYKSALRYLNGERNI